MQNIIHWLSSRPTTSCTNCMLFLSGDNCEFYRVFLVMFPSSETGTCPALQRRFPTSLLAVRSARWFNVWSHKTNLSFGKSYKQPLPSRRVDVKTDAQLPSHDTISKECLLQSVLRGKTTTVSKLVAFQPTFNFRVLITVCTSDTFPSVTSLTRHEVAPLQPVIERFFIQDAAVM